LLCVLPRACIGPSLTGQAASHALRPSQNSDNENGEHFDLDPAYHHSNIIQLT
jgi:hypothetical protein